MPYQVDWEGRLGVYVRFTEVVTPQDFADLNQQITGDVRFDDLRYTIGDFTGVRAHAFDLTNLAALAMPYAVLIGAAYTNRHIHAAYVVDDERIEELLDALLAPGLYPYPVQVFRSLDDARDWLASITLSFQREPESR